MSSWRPLALLALRTLRPPAGAMRAALSIHFLRNRGPGKSRADKLKICYIYYMIFSDAGIVLFRQDFREADRIISLYTLQHGRINLRLPGVNRAKGKLKAFTEPYACADYRIYARNGSVLGTVTGGKIKHIFPAIRQDLKRQSLALHFCELVMRLTPLRQPSAEKYHLLLQALTELEYAGANPAFAPAFTLRLINPCCKFPRNFGGVCTRINFPIWYLPRQRTCSL